MAAWLSSPRLCIDSAIRPNPQGVHGGRVTSGDGHIDTHNLSGHACIHCSHIHSFECGAIAICVCDVCVNWQHPLILTFGPPAQPWESSNPPPHATSNRAPHATSTSPPPPTPSSSSSHTPPSSSSAAASTPSPSTPITSAHKKTKEALAEADQWFKDTSSALSQWLTHPPTRPMQPSTSASSPTRASTHPSANPQQERGVRSGSKASRALMNKEARERQGVSDQRQPCGQ